MSLILEALKKSEAERRVGQPPGLLSPVIATAPPRRASWPWIALFGVPLLLAGAWWFGRQSVPDVPPEAVGAADAPAAESVASVQPARSDPTPVRAATERPPPAPEARPPAPARPAPTPALRAPPAPGSEAGAMERESEAMSAEAAEALLRAQEAPAAPAPRSLAPPPPPEAVAQPVPSSAAPPPVAGAQPPAPVEDLPELRALDPALRADMPPLKVSMHVFDADPARRFAIIDGRRVGEGDVLGRELWLIEIRRDGSVLRHRNARFLLPRPH